MTKGSCEEQPLNCELGGHGKHAMITHLLTAPVFCTSSMSNAKSWAVCLSIFSIRDCQGVHKPHNQAAQAQQVQQVQQEQRKSCAGHCSAARCANPAPHIAAWWCIADAAVHHMTASLVSVLQTISVNAHHQADTRGNKPSHNQPLAWHAGCNPADCVLRKRVVVVRL